MRYSTQNYSRQTVFPVSSLVCRIFFGFLPSASPYSPRYLISHISYNSSVSVVTATTILASLKISLAFQSQTGLLDRIRSLKLSCLVDAHKVRCHVSLWLNVCISPEVTHDALLFKNCRSFRCHLYRKLLSRTQIDTVGVQYNLNIRSIRISYRKWLLKIVI